MSTPAPKSTLRYGDLVEWLRENGIGKHTVEKLVANGTIKANTLVRGGAAFYSADQVKRDVIDKVCG